MRVLALDPGRRCGYAWRTPAGAWRVGTVHLDDLLGILTEACDDGCNVVAVEDIYLGPSVATFKALAVTQGRIMALCTGIGLTVQTVAPITWKSAMLRVNGFMPRTRPEQKRAAVWTARALGADVTDDNQADACCLCEYLTCVGRQEQIPLARSRGRRRVAAPHDTVRGTGGTTNAR